MTHAASYAPARPLHPADHAAHHPSQHPSRYPNQATTAQVLVLPSRTPHLPAQPAPGLGAVDFVDVVLEDDGLRLDLAGRTVTVDDRTIRLTFLEFGLLAHLLANPRRVFSRRQLMEAVWGYPDSGEGRTVDVHVARLRRKVGIRHRRRLATVHRVGYKYLPAA
ncbi:MAG TPA: winged helix-turn-helix domain-containing protein [Yinghuangia sp.]|uniref:winged helix-turn-helix domain-containing protein n=1 Tax=Yinghuangia sp. YIM S10712 TaxID=3436930 RepID=UPI002BF0D614|nr:winged helix-turn-helix domain-containing protein [Yinghuangia sp.]